MSLIQKYKYHQHYMRTLPLHPSQREIFTCDDYADFELTLRPTYDFYMKLMSFGNMIKVLEPRSLQEKIYKWLKKNNRGLQIKIRSMASRLFQALITKSY